MHYFWNTALRNTDYQSLHDMTCMTCPYHVLHDMMNDVHVSDYYHTEGLTTGLT